MMLWLVRHAQVLLPSGVCYGASDVASQAPATLAAAQALAAELPAGLALLSSPRKRCEQLAQALVQLRPDLNYQTSAKFGRDGFWLLGGPALERHSEKRC